MTAATTSRCCAGPGRGVAIGDAPDEVKAAADDVTESIDRDGPAAELRALVRVAISAGDPWTSRRRRRGRSPGVAAGDLSRHRGCVVVADIAPRSNVVSGVHSSEHCDLVPTYVVI